MSEIAFIIFLAVHLPKVWRRYYEPPPEKFTIRVPLERIM